MFDNQTVQLPVASSRPFSALRIKAVEFSLVSPFQFHRPFVTLNSEAEVV